MREVWNPVYVAPYVEMKMRWGFCTRFVSGQALRSLDDLDDRLVGGGGGGGGVIDQ